MAVGTAHQDAVKIRLVGYGYGDGCVSALTCPTGVGV